MKTIAKAITHKIAQDGWNRKFHTKAGRLLIVGETYLVHNNKIMHMLLPQEIIFEGGVSNRLIEDSDYLEEITKKS